MNATTSQDQTATFTDLLHAAVSEPGKIHTAYFAFHGYSITEKISQVDAEHTELLNTLEERQLNAIALPVVMLWAVPMAVWYGVGATASRWRPLVVQHRQIIAAAILVIGAGSFVSGVMDSDSFAGGVGAMMLVGGFLTWKGRIT